MNIEEMRRYVGVTGYSLGQVEKDYFQHVVLGALSRKKGGILVFKGGTSLQKMGIIPRFSEDIDFTARSAISIEELRDTIVSAVQRYNYQTETDSPVDDERTIGFRVKIQGPLYRNRRGICTIRIEASKRERVIMEPDRREFAPPYADILPYVLEVMRTEEILAEKVRALHTRLKARDLYDLFKMLDKGAEFDIGLTNEKLRYYKLKFDAPSFIERCERMERSWGNELQPIVEDVPPYKLALEAVKRALKL